MRFGVERIREGRNWGLGLGELGRSEGCREMKNETHLEKKKKDTSFVDGYYALINGFSVF